MTNMMEPTALAAAVAVAWVVFAGVMAIAWVLQQRTGNSGWVDVCWTIGLAAATLTALALSDVSGGWRTVLVALFLAIWAGRLALHLTVRSAKITDDPRYEKMAADWGDNAARNMFGILQFQAIVSLPLVILVLLAAANPAPFPSLLDGLGIAIFAVAIVGSALSDLQLTRFKSDPANKGKVCDTGLWAWSRHPNYFFEAMIWLAYLPLALAPSAAFGLSYLAIAGPLAIFFLLRFLSGVPPLEEHMRARYGEAWAAYERRTSAFSPRPPRAN